MSKNPLQKGFVFRQENCVGCGGCTVECQLHNELPEDVRFRKVDCYEVKDAKGRVRDVWLSHSCMHCETHHAWQFAPPSASYSVSTASLYLTAETAPVAVCANLRVRMTQSSSAKSTAKQPSATCASNCLIKGCNRPASQAVLSSASKWITSIRF